MNEIILCTAPSFNASIHSGIRSALWGVRITCSHLSIGCDFGIGSTSNTSKAAPPICPF